jgi:hypothetical protein
MREWPRDENVWSCDPRGESCSSISEPAGSDGSEALRRLTLLRELLVRVCVLRGGVAGGILDRREVCRLGLETNGSSPGTVSSVKPDRELGALARTGAGASGRSWSMLGRHRPALPAVKDRARGEYSVDGFEADDVSRLW